MAKQKTIMEGKGFVAFALSSGYELSTRRLIEVFSYTVHIDGEKVTDKIEQLRRQTGKEIVIENEGSVVPRVYVRLNKHFDVHISLEGYIVVRETDQKIIITVR